MDDYQRHLDAFLRLLERIEYLRFNGMVGRKHVTGPDEGSPLTWDQWKKNDIVGIVASKQGNAAFWIMVCRTFPKSSDGQALLKHLLSITDNDLLSFYRETTGNKAVAYLGQRPDFTLEILDCEHGNRSQWDHALRLAGIAESATRQEPKREEVVSQPPDAAEVSLLRDRAWDHYCTSLLTQEYWARKVTLEKKMILSRDIKTVVGGIFLAAILPTLGASWLSTPAALAVTIVVEILFHRSKPAKLADAEYAKERWAGLAHDLRELWHEGEHYYWEHDSAVKSVATYSERIRGLQASEQEAQDDDLVDECHHAINRRLTMERKRNAQHEDADTRASAAEAAGPAE